MKSFEQYLIESQVSDQIVFVEDITDTAKKSGYLRNRDTVDVIAIVSTKNDWKGSVPDRSIYELEKTEYTKGYGKKVYRYDTPKIRGKMQPIIKIDAKKFMVYFQTEESSENDDPIPKFETRGEKIQYLIVYDKKKFLAGQ